MLDIKSYYNALMDKYYPELAIDTKDCACFEFKNSNGLSESGVLIFTKEGISKYKAQGKKLIFVIDFIEQQVLQTDLTAIPEAILRLKASTRAHADELNGRSLAYTDDFDAKYTFIMNGHEHNVGNHQSARMVNVDLDKKLLTIHQDGKKTELHEGDAVYIQKNKVFHLKNAKHQAQKKKTQSIESLPLADDKKNIPL